MSATRVGKLVADASAAKAEHKPQCDEEVLASTNGPAVPAASIATITAAVNVDRTLAAASRVLAKPAKQAMAESTQGEQQTPDDSNQAGAGVVPDAAKEAASNEAKVSQLGVVQDFDMFSAEPIEPMDQSQVR